MSIKHMYQTAGAKRINYSIDGANGAPAFYPVTPENDPESTEAEGRKMFHRSLAKAAVGGALLAISVGVLHSASEANDSQLHHSELPGVTSSSPVATGQLELTKGPSTIELPIPTK